MNYRLFVHIRGRSEQEVVSLNVAYNSAETLGRMADALGEIGLGASISPQSGDEAVFVTPKEEPAVRTVLLALVGWSEETSFEEVGEAARTALRDLKRHAQEGRDRVEAATAGARA